MNVNRILDIMISGVSLAVLCVPMFAIAVAIRITSPGPAIFWSERVGRHNRHFLMPKFRTMRIDTPVIATHLLESPSQHLTPIGGFLRRTSLDELPQLWSILSGDMTLVGPRPALHNQFDLITLRTAEGIHLLTPGLTGWAQVNGRDDVDLREKVAFDIEYKRNKSLLFDLRILVLTVVNVILSKGVSH